MSKTTLNVLNFEDYREYLLAYYDEKKKQKPLWGQVVWARQLGFQNSSVLNLVLNGKRKPSAALVKRLIAYLELTPPETEHFIKLIWREKLDTTPESNDKKETPIDRTPV